MSVSIRSDQGRDVLDVREAAALLGRHPETIRRWIWSGRLTAARRGNRLVVQRADLEAIAGVAQGKPTLNEWMDRAGAFRESAIEAHGSRESAADLVIEDRLTRSEVTRSQ